MQTYHIDDKMSVCTQDMAIELERDFSGLAEESIRKEKV